MDQVQSTLQDSDSFPDVKVELFEEIDIKMEDIDIKTEDLHHSCEIKEEPSIIESEVTLNSTQKETSTVKSRVRADGQKFAIIKHIDEQDALGVIPLKWTSSNEKSCLFPPTKSDLKREKLIYTEAEPTEEWTAIRIAVIHKYETYLSARKHYLKRVGETINIDTDEDDDASLSRKRKRKHIQIHDEYEDLGIPIVSVPSSQPDRSCSPGLSSFRHTQANNISQSPGNFPSPSTSSGSWSFSDADRLLLAQIQVTMATLAEQLEAVNRKVDRVLANQDSFDTASQNSHYHSILGLLPLQSLKDFNVLEDKLKTDENFINHLVKILGSTGGKDPRSSTMDIMKRLMSDSLAEEFSYSGKVRNHEPKKIGFWEKKLCGVVHATAQKIFKEEATDDVIKNALCGWLQQAKSRRNRRDQRLQKRMSDVTIIADDVST